jgi:hypothetical protein
VGSDFFCENLVDWKTCKTFAQPLIQTLVLLRTSEFLTAIFFAEKFGGLKNL